MKTEPKFCPPLDLDKLNPRMNVTRLRDVESLHLLKDFFQRKKEFGYDLETNVVKDLNARFIRTIQAGDRDEQYVIDLMDFARAAAPTMGMDAVELCKKAQRDVALRRQVFGPIIDIIQPVLDSKEWLKLGQNLVFEYENTRLNLGIRMWNLYDTLLAEQIILCGLVPPKAEGYFAMDDLVRRYAGRQIDKTLQTSFDDFSKELSDAQVTYAALDVRFPFPIRAHQVKAMERDGLMRTAQIEFDALPAFGDMRVHGFFCSREVWTEKYSKNVEKLKGILAEMDKLFIPVVGLAKEPVHDLVALEEAWREFGRRKLTDDEKAQRDAARTEFYKARGGISAYRKASEKFQGTAAINYASNDQLQEALWKMPGITKAKLPNTNDLTLAKLATVGEPGKPGYKKGLPVIDLIRDYRELSKAIKSYGTAFLDKYISPISGRIHSRINQIGAETGRTSSDNPNVQNIPKDKDYRSAFRARKGYKIITTDVQGCELRIITNESGEPVWLEAFHKDQDVHSLGAEFIFTDAWKAATGPNCKFYFEGKFLKCDCPGHKKIRDPIKNINFGTIYGLGEQGYAEQTGKTRTEARADLTKHRLWVPTLWGYLERLKTEARMNLESRTAVGRRRIYKQPTWENAKQHWLNDPDNKKLKREPRTFEIKKEMAKMFSSIGRAGCNMPMQGGNGDLVKLAMGCGFDSNGKPFLWHILEPELGGLLENLVHDELVVEGPEENADKIQIEKQDAILRAGREIYKLVDMESDSTIADCWRK